MRKVAYPKDAMLEILKRLQDTIADVRNTQVDMRRDVRDLKTSNARILSMIGGSIKAEPNGQRGSTP
jgi:hypothetical protein